MKPPHEDSVHAWKVYLDHAPSAGGERAWAWVQYHELLYEQRDIWHNVLNVIVFTVLFSPIVYVMLRAIFSANPLFF